MVGLVNQLEQQWQEYLDEDCKDLIFYKFIYSQDLKKVNEFILIYITTINNKPIEVLKYDFSKKESFHVHFYYKKPQVKKFINLNQNLSPKETFEEMIKFSQNIKKNWRKLKLEYLNNYY